MHVFDKNIAYNVHCSEQLALAVLYFFSPTALYNKVKGAQVLGPGIVF